MERQVDEKMIGMVGEINRWWDAWVDGVAVWVSGMDRSVDNYI